MKFPKLCPRCFEDYTKLIQLRDGEYCCDLCLTEIESREIETLIVKKEKK